MNIIYQGEDAILQFTVKDSDGAAIDLTGYTNIIAIAVDVNDSITAKFSRETKAGFDSANFTQLNQTTDMGKFQIKLTDTVTKEIDEGNIRFEVKATDGTNQYTDVVSKGDNSFIFQVKRARSKDIEA